jgi:nitric oxide reductase subunit C
MLTKAATRAFFFGGTALFALVFVGLTVQTHSTLAERTHPENLTDEVRRGLAVWGRNNCENCHTLLGEGAYYAPDLTAIVQQRGERYLAAFLADPSRFYSESRDGRLMPTLGLSDAEIAELIAFLGWVGKIDTNGWPPRPIVVSSVPARVSPAGSEGAVAQSAEQRGSEIFQSTAACASCHSLAADVVIVGPSLARIGTLAGERVRDPSYTGKASDAGGYLRESILDPDAFVVPEDRFKLEEHSLMPAIVGRQLTEAQLADLVTYLGTLK